MASLRSVVKRRVMGGIVAAAAWFAVASATSAQTPGGGSDAEAARQRALGTVRDAPSESQRLAAEETLRLIDLEGAIGAARERLGQQRAALEARKDRVIGWQRRARDARSAGPGQADATYVALRRDLVAARAEFDTALDERQGDASSLPPIGPDPLAGLAPNIVFEPEQRRRAVEQLRADTLAEERALREARAAALLEEITVLNRERLELLPHLSTDKRRSITGLSDAGLDQAGSELTQLFLILRHDRQKLADWVVALRGGSEAPRFPMLYLAFGAVPYLLTVLVFAWWRRRSGGWLAEMDAHLEMLDRQSRRPSPSRLHQALSVLRQTHRSLEWLTLALVVIWLLPADLRALQQVRFLIVIVGWTLGSAVIVDLINALASRHAAATGSHDAAVAGLRLRSLRLVGRVVLSFALVLFVSSRLVGRGTLHRWVEALCWVAAVLLLGVLVARWRSEIIARLERRRRKALLTRWVLAHRRGPIGFIAAGIGGAYLFLAGAIEIGRRRVTAFNVTRHAHAYLFRREIDRLATERTSAHEQALNAEVLASLHPARPGASWLPSPTDPVLQALASRARLGRGGVVALVAGRGAGKSSLLSRLATDVEGARVIECRELSIDALQASLAQLPSLVLFDHAESLVRPVLGGLSRFDELSSLCRARCPGVLWVFAIDSIAWPLLSRARDAQALFDQVWTLPPWNDEQIGRLLSVRSEEAGITPSFEDLLDRLPPAADELDRLQALEEKRAGYYRMIWDYARGNPGMALEVWRASLITDVQGQVRVRPLRAPPATDLDALPDAGLFVLRAILMMAPASVSDVAEATRLSEMQVMDAFGYGRTHGYLVEEAGRVSIGWEWLRSVMLLLERRHLVLSP